MYGRLWPHYKQRSSAGIAKQRSSAGVAKQRSSAGVAKQRSSAGVAKQPSSAGVAKQRNTPYVNNYTCVTEVITMNVTIHAYFTSVQQTL